LPLIRKETPNKGERREENTYFGDLKEKGVPPVRSVHKEENAIQTVIGKEKKPRGINRRG